MAIEDGYVLARCLAQYGVEDGAAALRARPHRSHAPHGRGLGRQHPSLPQSARSPTREEGRSSSTASGRASASPTATNGSSATTRRRWKSEVHRACACRGSRTRGSSPVRAASPTTSATSGRSGAPSCARHMRMHASRGSMRPPRAPCRASWPSLPATTTRPMAWALSITYRTRSTCTTSIRELRQPAPMAALAAARDEARHVGEPIAAVIAETAELAADAAERVDVQYGHCRQWRPCASTIALATRQPSCRRSRGRRMWCGIGSFTSAS